MNERTLVFLHEFNIMHYANYYQTKCGHISHKNAHRGFVNVDYQLINYAETLPSAAAAEANSHLAWSSLA